MTWGIGVSRRSGLPAPRRRTFAAAILAYALSMLPALRHPCLRLSATPTLGACGNPDPSHKEAFYEASGLVISTGTTHWSYCSAVR
jgi:hypothetical protein